MQTLRSVLGQDCERTDRYPERRGAPRSGALFACVLLSFLSFLSFLSRFSDRFSLSELWVNLRVALKSVLVRLRVVKLPSRFQFPLVSFGYQLCFSQEMLLLSTIIAFPSRSSLASDQKLASGGWQVSFGKRERGWKLVALAWHPPRLECVRRFPATLEPMARPLCPPGFLDAADVIC